MCSLVPVSNAFRQGPPRSTTTDYGRSSAGCNDLSLAPYDRNAAYCSGGGRLGHRTAGGHPFGKSTPLTPRTADPVVTCDPVVKSVVVVRSVVSSPLAPGAAKSVMLVVVGALTADVARSCAPGLN